MSVQIQSLGFTVESDDGVVLVMQEEEMPPDCYVIFIKKEDYPELLEKLKD